MDERSTKDHLTRDAGSSDKGEKDGSASILKLAGSLDIDNYKITPRGKTSKDLAAAIAPGGPWGKIWLAAHWDRKLKREDYREINIVALAADMLEKSDMLTLHYLGNFLLGLCKCLIKQSVFFEARARELHDNLMLAFSHKEDELERKRKRVRGADASAAALDTAGEASAVDKERQRAREELERALISRRHLAALEEITLKPPTAADVMVPSGIPRDTFGSISESEKATLSALTKRMRNTFFGEATAILPAAPDTLAPLVDYAEIEGPADAGVILEADPLGLVDMDLDPLENGANVDMGGPAALEPGEEVLGAGPLGEGPLVKRPRRKAFLFDDPPEISKEVYQGYMNDRSAITRSDEYDNTILLPHTHPLMPNFMTTYTGMCKSLMQGLAWGHQVAERRRNAMSKAEAQFRPHDQPSDWMPPPNVDGILQGRPGMEPAPEEPAVQEFAPLDAGPRWEPPIHIDVSDAPSHMGGVISGNMDQEDQSANADARLGYSGRTEKMHKFLAKEFQSQPSASSATAGLSYEQMCRRQSGGDRGVIAGCFFELLVLRTNGVVNLRQDKPFADISIERSRSWGGAA